MSRPARASYQVDQGAPDRRHSQAAHRDDITFRNLTAPHDESLPRTDAGSRANHDLDRMNGIEVQPVQPACSGPREDGAVGQPVKPG